MPCYVVTPETVNAVANGLVDVRLANGMLRLDNSETFGAYATRVLADENIRSFDHRYQGRADIMREEREMSPYFIRRRYPMGLSLACAICLEHQSNSCQDHGGTAAAWLLRELISHIKDAGESSMVSEQNIIDAWGDNGISKLTRNPDGTVSVDYRYRYFRGQNGIMSRTCDRITFDADGWLLLIEHGVFSDINE